MNYRFAKPNDVNEFKSFLQKVNKSFLPLRTTNRIPLAKLFTQLTKDSQYKIILAIQKKKIIGYAAFIINKNKTAKIRAMAVSKENQGKGVGKKLAKKALKYIKSKKVHTVVMRTWETNNASRGLFEKLGFRKYYTIHNDRVNGESTFWLRKEL